MEHDLELLVASIAALALGPLIYRLARGSRAATIVLHVLLVASILALVALEILPECVELAGGAALLAAGAGLLGPLLAERGLRARRSADDGTASRRGLTLWLALAALALHAFADGAALVGGGAHGHGHAHAHGHGALHGLGVAVVLHRLPVGAALWWLLAPVSTAVAVLALALVSAATLGGFALGASALPALGGAGVALFQAFVAGVLLHVLVHRHGTPAAEVVHGHR